MDSRDLVQEITARVLARLGGQPVASEGSGPALTAAGQARNQAGLGQDPALVLITGGMGPQRELLAALERLQTRHASLRLVLSPSAAAQLTMPAIRRAVPSATVATAGDPGQLLDGVGMVILPNLSLNAASKVSQLQADGLVCILSVMALLRGLPVVASHDTWWSQGEGLDSAPAGVRRQIEAIRARLEDMGVRLVCQDALAAGSGMPVPVPVPAPASASNRQAVSCAQQNGSECSACGQCVAANTASVQRLVAQGAERVAAAQGTVPSRELAAVIDHTLLKADATEAQVRTLCQEAREFEFASVCVNPSWVSLAAGLLVGSPVKVCTVIGFPLGATTATSKAIETRDAIANGAQEIDMVINVGALKSGDDERVRADIEAVVQAARGKALVKVILETALLTREEKIKACLLAKMAGADFVKTSTGFSTGGATVEDIALMRETVGPGMGVKASGGVGDTAKAQAMVAAGATRIGASASVSIVTGKKPAGAKGY